MNLIVKHYTEIEKEKWDLFVYSNSMGWAYHLYDVNLVDWDSSKENVSFAIVDSENNDEIFMIMTLFKTNKHKILAKFNRGREVLKSRWGFVVKDNLSKKVFKTLKKTYEDYIDKYMLENRIKRFTLSLPVLSEYMINQKPIINPLIYYNFSPEVRYTYLLDLSKSDEKILGDFKQTTRNLIRRIENSDMYDVVESIGSEDDLQVFLALAKETYDRTGYCDVDKDCLINVFKNLLPKKIAKVFFLVEKATNEKIATVSILQYKNNTAYYWWGFSVNEKIDGINKYLLYKSICIIRESFNKTGFFEVGGAYPYARSGKNKGLNDYKKHFADFLLPIYKGTYSTKNKRK